VIRRALDHPLIPVEYRHNFIHLYQDIAWFGVLNGSALAFLAVYATRLGASGFQIGLLSAMPALVNLVFAIPSGQWLQRGAISKAVFWTSVFNRLGYLLWIPLPWLFNEKEQVWALIALALLMAIPGTALAVGFNTLFAEAVPAEWRAHVAGIRNAVLAITYMLATLGCGYLLDHLPFPSGYQVVFGIGFLGAAMSSYHLLRVRSLACQDAPPSPESRKTGGRRSSGHATAASLSGSNIWRTPFRKVLLVLFGFHLAQYLAIPIFPIFYVRGIGLSDDQIGIGMAIFYFTVLLGSTQLARLTRRLDHRRVTGLGAVLMSIYPVLLSLSRGFGLYLLTSALGGFAWAMVSGALANYLLERVPPDERPRYLAWYNIVLNASILIGCLSGPLMADWLGLSVALVTFGVLRLLAGLAILRWG